MAERVNQRPGPDFERKGPGSIKRPDYWFRAREIWQAKCPQKKKKNGIVGEVPWWAIRQAMVEEWERENN